MKINYGKVCTSRIQEYTFVNLEQMICDICDEFDSGSEIEIVVTTDESADVIKALMATGKFTPYTLDYDFDDYKDEYCILLSHCNGDGDIYINKAKLDNGKYVHGDAFMTDVMFISYNISQRLYDHYVGDGMDIVLYDFED